jgi:hypothetical protein
MAVAVDAAATSQNGAGTLAPGGRFDVTTQTVGSGANRALVLTVMLDNNAAPCTAQWDAFGTPQSMTKIVESNAQSGVNALPWSRSLRGTILAGSSSSRAHDNDRLRLPPASPPRSSKTGKKESADRPLNQLCPPFATLSSNSSRDHRRTDASNADDGFATSE